jgi:hypothetical protein
MTANYVTLVGGAKAQKSGQYWAEPGAGVLLQRPAKHGRSPVQPNLKTDRPCQLRAGEASATQPEKTAPIHNVQPNLHACFAP